MKWLEPPPQYVISQSHKLAFSRDLHRLTRGIASHLEGFSGARAGSPGYKCYSKVMSPNTSRSGLIGEVAGSCGIAEVAADYSRLIRIEVAPARYTWVYWVSSNQIGGGVPLRTCLTSFPVQKIPN